MHSSTKNIGCKKNTSAYSQNIYYNFVSGGALINIKLTFMTKVNIQEHMALAIKV
jgi:hypothetical protein